MYRYIFCNICNLICDIKSHHRGFDIYICQDHGEVDGIEGDICLCIGCENFDPMYPFHRDKPLDGCCDVYIGMSFNMFKRKSKCKYFEVSYDL